MRTFISGLQGLLLVAIILAVIAIVFNIPGLGFIALGMMLAIIAAGIGGLIYIAVQLRRK